jgi:hypothetical protein
LILQNFDLYGLSGTVEIIKIMTAAETVGRTEKTMNTYGLSVVRPLAYEVLEIVGRRWEDNINIDLRESHCEDG